MQVSFQRFLETCIQKTKNDREKEKCMLYTSAEANKLLRALRDEEMAEKMKEAENHKFEAALGENIEDVRPDYSLEATNKKLEEIRNKIVAVKHAINVFNVKTVIVDNITIDMALIMLPQLTDRKRSLYNMKTLPAKKRNRLYGTGTANVIDYTYANFSPEEAEAEYTRISEEIDRIQLALDKVNATEKMEIDI